MTLQQTIEKMEKEFDEQFPGDVTTMEDDGLHVRITSSLYNRARLKAFIQDRTRTLLESFGEEIIGEDEVKKIPKDFESFNLEMPKYVRTSLRIQQRLKVKEILEVIK